LGFPSQEQERRAWSTGLRVAVSSTEPPLLSVVVACPEERAPFLAFPARVKRLSEVGAKKRDIIGVWAA
jgi:hypothetical protein